MDRLDDRVELHQERVPTFPNLRGESSNRNQRIDRPIPVDDANPDNPADDASRGLEMSDFLRNNRWLKGPSFLHEREEEWPESKFDIVLSDNLELKKEVYTTSIEPATTIEDLVSRSSNWVHTLRRVAWLLKFLDWIK